MADKKEVDKYILAPEIKEFGEWQVFEFHGKDARGYDFGVRLSPIGAVPLMNEPVRKADADRVNVYAGSDPEKIDDIATEIEITIGNEQEVHTIDKATITYIPGGVPFGHRIIGKTDKNSWILTLTLPPKYIQPENPAGNPPGKEE